MKLKMVLDESCANCKFMQEKRTRNEVIYYCNIFKEEIMRYTYYDDGSALVPLNPITDVICEENKYEKE